MNKFFGILCFFGFLLCWGTAGASDANMISLIDMTRQYLYGMLMVLIGFVGLNLCENKHKRRCKR